MWYWTIQRCLKTFNIFFYSILFRIFKIKTIIYSSTSSIITDIGYSSRPFTMVSINKKFSSFSDDFKSVINLLIALLTQVISSLLYNTNDILLLTYSNVPHNCIFNADALKTSPLRYKWFFYEKHIDIF